MTPITDVRAYRQWQPFAAGAYGTSGGTAEGFDAVVVALDTAAGITGWGEMAPLGSFYSEAFAAGTRAGVAELAPLLIGLDAAQPRLVARRMGEAMRGQAYVKSALDMACWDAAARQQGRPLCEALGGRFGDAADLYRSVPPLPAAQAAALAAAHVAEGYRRLQVKVGGDPDEDAERLAAVRDAAGAGIALVADANGGWSSGEALRFVRAAGDAGYDARAAVLVARGVPDRPVALRPCRWCSTNRSTRCGRCSPPGARAPPTASRSSCRGWAA